MAATAEEGASEPAEYSAAAGVLAGETKEIAVEQAGLVDGTAVRLVRG